MKDLVYLPHTQIPPDLAAWYRTLSLPDRIITHNPRLNQQHPISELARKRLQRWKEQPALKNGENFAERLALGGLTEADLLALLAEPVEVLQERISTPLPWLEKLLLAFEHTHEFDALALPQEGFDPHHIAFLRIIQPLLHHPIQHIQTTIQQLCTTYASIPFDP